MPTAVVVSWLVPAVVLLLAAVAKVGASARTAEQAFLKSLGWPTSRWLVLAHVLIEAALGVGLIATTGTLLIAVCAATLALMIGYVGTVVRALRLPERPPCACFGEQPEPVTSRTLARNLLLTGFSTAALLAAIAGGSPRELLDPPAWWWLTAVLATGALLFTMLPIVADGPVPVTADDDLDDYLRTPIPLAYLETADGIETTLRELADERPQLLFFLNGHCGSCLDTAAEIPQWQTRLQALDLRIVAPINELDLVRNHWPDLAPAQLRDVRGEVWRLLGGATPAAVLLGADGLLAGGPVSGRQQVAAFVEQIELQLASG